MDKKSRSRPMKEIMRRLPEKEFEIVIFGNDCLLNDPVEKWPIVDCLIGFYSGGFPLKKAQEYVKLRQPWCCNNLESEYVLRDRRRVYNHLQKNHIVDRYFDVIKSIKVFNDQNGLEYFFLLF